MRYVISEANHHDWAGNCSVINTQNPAVNRETTYTAVGRVILSINILFIDFSAEKITVDFLSPHLFSCKPSEEKPHHRVFRSSGGQPPKASSWWSRQNLASPSLEVNPARLTRVTITHAVPHVTDHCRHTESISRKAYSLFQRRTLQVYLT